jgi:hypothetical protein
MSANTEQRKLAAISFEALACHAEASRRRMPKAVGAK